jgi:V/A-type H+-transporting ATPase subunit I
VYGSFFGNEEVIRPLYERPLDNIMNMLIIAIIFGVVVIIAAMAINIINAVKRKNIKEMLFDKNGLAGFIFYIGVIIFALVMVINGKPLKSFLFIAAFFILPVLLMFLKQPLNNLMHGNRFLPEKDKGTFFVEAFFEVFEAVLSFFTNTLSFIRVGAFALSHAGLSLAVWTLFDMVGGLAGGIITLIIGNLLILALEGLVVGIQGLRLEYYEMFSRFFNGEGREFKPMKINTGRG